MLRTRFPDLYSTPGKYLQLWDMEKWYFWEMSWLDPDRLAALYGQKRPKTADAAVVAATEPTEKQHKKEKKKEKKEKKALKEAEKAQKKAEKKARKKLEKLGKLELAPPVKKLKRKAECCEKYKKGKRCGDCPLR